MTRRQRRLLMIAMSLSVVTVAVGLVLYALTDRIVFFNSPSDLASRPPLDQRVRLGGLVEVGSLARESGGRVRFSVTDGGARVPVEYTGILPDLFREGQGVVAEGTWGAGGQFAADSILAKHDETYLPRDVADALKERGMWEGDAPKGGPTPQRPSRP